jgi:hypothetical protein
MVRQLDSDTARENALRKAAERQREGCQACAEGYARLALRNGASRRDFLRYGLGGLAALVVGTGAGLAHSVPAEADWCYYNWFCWGTWHVIQTCCSQYWGGLFWITICEVESINDTGWRC